MAYYVRSFCKSNKIPTINQLESNLKKEYPQIRIETEGNKDSGNWSNFEIFYKKDKKPILIELNINDVADSLAAEECNEFINEIGKPGISLSRRNVLKHLKNTKFIVASQLPSDIDNEGYHLNGELLNYFVNNHEGLIQADGEGFYKGHKIIVGLK